MRKPDVLVACTPQGVAPAKEIFGAAFELTFAHDLVTVARLLRRGRFFGVVGTLQFDDSRLFELVPIATAERVPLVAAKLTATVLPESEVKAAFKAALVAGFRGCIDARALTVELGKEGAARECQRRIMEACSNPDSQEDGGSSDGPTTKTLRPA